MINTSFKEYLNEMVFLTKSAFPEFTEDQINQAVNYMKSGNEIGLIENDKYILIHKDGFYALRNNEDTIFGWIKLEDISMFDIDYKKVNIIYIIPKYRKSKALFLLIHGIRELLNNKILIDDAIFNDGRELISSLINRPDRFKISILNKSDGTISDFTNFDKINLSHSIIVENDRIGLYLKVLPGSEHKSKYSIFDEYHEELK